MDSNDEHDEELSLIVTQFVGTVAYMCTYYLPQFHRGPQRNCYLTRREFVSDIMQSNEHCHNLLRMNVESFQRFVYIFRGTGRLKDTVHCSIEEQLAMFLHIVSHSVKNRSAKYYFKRSGETISRHFKTVLDAIIGMEEDFLKQPSSETETPKEICDSNRMWPYFKVWSHCLIMELVHQANEGYKVDKGFKEHAYTAACSVLNSNFELSLHREHCVNRLKTIKKKYRLIQDMLSKSGFSWNPVMKMVECSDQVWASFVAANPDAKGLRGKKIDLIDELTIVCGTDHATGEWASSAKDINANMSKQMNDSEEEYTPLADPGGNMIGDDLVDSEGNCFVNPLGNVGSQTTGDKRNQGSSSCPSKRRAKKPRTAESVAETMTTIANNMARLADAYEKSKPCINYSELYKAVMDVEELDIPSRMNAFEFLNADPIKARAFLIYPSEMRYLFLLRQLSPSSSSTI